MQVAGTDGQREPRLVTDALDVLELDSGRTAGAAHDRIGGLLLAGGVELALTGRLFLDPGHRAIDVRARHAAGDRAEDRKSTRLNSSHSCATRMPSSTGKKKTTRERTNTEYK